MIYTKKKKLTHTLFKHISKKYLTYENKVYIKLISI